jgi:hypothetical protein
MSRKVFEDLLVVDVDLVGRRRGLGLFWSPPEFGMPGRVCPALSLSEVGYSWRM